MKKKIAVAAVLLLAVLLVCAGCADSISPASGASIVGTWVAESGGRYEGVTLTFDDNGNVTYREDTYTCTGTYEITQSLAGEYVNLNMGEHRDFYWQDTFLVWDETKTKLIHDTYVGRISETYFSKQ